MNYLLDKKQKESKFFKIILIIVILVVLFFFRTKVLNGLSFASHSVFRPVLVLGNKIGESFSNASSFFYSKKSLLLENETLKTQILESEADRANYASVVDENNKLKEILGRKQLGVNMILGAILSKPNQSIYGTFIIDAGIDQGIAQGQRVFVFGNVPIGRIAEVYSNSSKVVLFSNPGEKTEAVVSLVSADSLIDPAVDSSLQPTQVSIARDAYLEAIGRGGGNFEMILPRDFVLKTGDEVVLPGMYPYVLATVSTIISDPRDSFQKALLASPINIQELKFVEVEK